MSGALPEFDVVVAGGGLVGGSLAIALASAGCRTAVVEAVAPDSEVQPSFDDRTIALSRGSCRILQQLGVWPALADQVWPVRNIHVSEQGRFGTAMLDAQEQGIPELGFVIRSRDLGLAIWDRLQDFPNLRTFSPARVIATEVEGDLRSVEIDAGHDKQRVTSRLLAVADGARSALRQSLGIAATTHDYEQVAVVAKLQIEPDRTGYMAYERFTPRGPLALLPGPAGEYTLVLARDTAAADEVMQLDDTDFLATVQTEFGFRLGRLQRIGKRSMYPLELTKANEVIAERAVIVGNAAHGLHPVAGQGFNLGLRDVACLAEVLADARQSSGSAFDSGAPDLLAQYMEWRTSDQARVVQFTDGLIRLFGVPGKSMSIARGLALSAFDVLPGGKQELARQTMGLTGRLTRLARGLPL